MSERLVDKAGKQHRFLALEGLRGVSAVSVVLFHILITFLPFVVYGSSNVQHFGFEDNIYKTPLLGFFNGSFAVSIFFVLSGFVLSIAFFQTNKESIVKKMAVKRYLRLMLPACASILIAWCIVAAGGYADFNALSAFTSGWGSSGVQYLQPDFMTALYQGTTGIFLDEAMKGSPYNSATWTMFWEFLGSFLVFSTLLLVGKSSKRWVVYTALFVLLLPTMLLPFVIGMALADLYANRIDVFEKNYFTWLFLLVGIFLAGYPLVEASGSIYQSLVIPGFTYQLNLKTAYTIGAACVLIAVLSSRMLQRIFSLKVISGLGKYTYSLYLIHMPILFVVSAETFLFLKRFPQLEYVPIMLIITFTYLVVVIVGTVLFEKFIDRPSIKLSNKFADLVLKPPK